MDVNELTDDNVRALLKKAGPGPWDVDGPVWNRTVWRSSENRVCFMAHSNGLDDDRDMATSRLVAAAPDLARALLEARAERDAARADTAAAQALVVVAKKAAQDYCWQRYKDREPMNLSSPAVFTSHEWQKIGEAIDAALAQAPEANGLAALAGLRDSLRIISTAASLSIAQQTAFMLLDKLGVKND